MARAAWHIAFVLVVGCATGRVANASDKVEFSREIAPLLRDRCLSCHNDRDRKGDVSFQTPADLVRKGLVKPGAPEESPLMKMVSPAADGSRPRMPRTGTPLTDAELARLRDWIAQGAVWPDGVTIEQPDASGWWAYRPLSRHFPSVDAARVEDMSGPIDLFVLERLREKKIEPNGAADKRTWLRRVTVTLTGLPPSPELLSSFMADERPDARERIVDRLLASPAYGEQWGRHWLDVARFGESNGFERNVLINNLWPYRDYVIRSFNEDKPFKRFILEQLAGDVIGPDDPEVAVGTAFLVCGPYDNVGNQDPVQAAIIRANTIDEMIRATGEAFLGMTMGCARCHDHKFDPITQDDYYAWYATFAGVYHGSREIASDSVRRRREQRLAPLVAKKHEIETERNRLIASIVERAASAGGITSNWVREPVSRYYTEEKFDPVQAKYVRLTVLGRDDRPDLRSDFTIDEFEVWTADDPLGKCGVPVRRGHGRGGQSNSPRLSGRLLS